MPLHALLQRKIRKVLKGDSMSSLLEDYVNSDAYPDTMMYDDDGNVIGMYEQSS